MDSPDLPLERTIAGTTMRFDTATVTLEGVLPPGFSGPVAKAAQDLFRPLSVVLDRGPVAGPKPGYSILLSGLRHEVDSDVARVLSIDETSALCVGGFVAVWLENFGTEPAPFRVTLRGHSGRAYRGSSPPMNEEVGCSSVVLGMIAGKRTAT